MEKTFYILTLGCKINQYESQALREAWLGLGLRESPEPEGAAHIVVNSCAITAKAVADVRAAVRRLHRAAPGARIIVTGCAAKIQAETLKGFPGVERIVFQDAKKSLLGGPEAAFADLRQEYAIKGFGRSRAVLKVQDGCSHGCAYCIVPSARGDSRSRAPEDCLAEVERLLDSGIREIVLSGVNLRQYEHKGQDFWDLTRFLEEELGKAWAGRARFRISSLEPGQLHARALEVLGNSRLIAPHLHISMQSGSPDVLERMGRGHYRPEQLTDFLRELAGIWPVFGLGADFIAGFPGETEEDHKMTLDFFTELPFTYAHVFPYSPRPGTRAAKMPGQTSHDEKKQRSSTLRALAKKKKEAFMKAMLDMPRQRVVFEDRGAGSAGEDFLGVNEYYVECRALPEAGIRPRELTLARPNILNRGRLLVEKCPV